MRDVIRFRSELFEVEPGEDGQTNPGCYGKALVHWLRDRFAERGYPQAAVVPEDFGWCLMLEREPFLLWVGCASETGDGAEVDAEVDAAGDDGDGDAESRADRVPSPADVTWLCFVAAETPVWTSAFWKRLAGRVDPQARAAQVEAELAALLAAEPGIAVEAAG